MTDPAVIAAFIAAFASLLVAILGYFITKKNQSEVETLKAHLAEQQAERDARRDYEYEARKRLYHDYRPLLFQLVERSQVALNRIYNFKTRLIDYQQQCLLKNEFPIKWGT